MVTIEKLIHDINVDKENKNMSNISFDVHVLNAFDEIDIQI